jgi:hypothetical protein
MADVSKKLKAIMDLVEEGAYFTINRPRQYGKTTTLFTLAEILKKQGSFTVVELSFEAIGDALFESEKDFLPAFIQMLARQLNDSHQTTATWLKEKAASILNFDALSLILTECLAKIEDRIVLLIDEVDKSSNNQLFLSFLGALRDKYLRRRTHKTFHSVVLVGVHDVKTLKLKIRPDAEQKYNSPWNIATDFKVDMNLQVEEIIPMLEEYSKDTQVKMDTKAIAEALFYYTSGYPFLVSKLCKMLDEELLPGAAAWTETDVEDAVKQLVTESNTNFDWIVKNLENNPELYQLVYKVAIDNEPFPFSINNPTVNLGVIYGIFANRKGLVIHNRIYQEVLVDYMSFDMLLSRVSKSDMGGGYKHADGSLNMEAVLLGFQAFMKKEYHKKDRDFLEWNGRLVFLAFIKPIINGSGHDFKEPQISEERRLDVVITYLEQKFIAELKIWRGEAAHQVGLQQLCDYLDRDGLDKCFLIIFDHAEVKNWRNEWIEVRDKKVFAVWV